MCGKERKCEEFTTDSIIFLGMYIYRYIYIYIGIYIYLYNVYIESNNIFFYSSLKGSVREK